MFRSSFCKLRFQTRSLHLSCRQYYNPSLNTHHRLANANSYPSSVTIKNGCCFESLKHFSVSPVNNSPLVPIAALVLRPVTKFFAIILGIRIRRWWTKLSKEEKQTFWYNVHKRRKQITVLLGSIVGLFTMYCVTHIDIDPITGKYRLILFTHQQMVELANSIANELLSVNENSIFPPSHPLYKRAKFIAMKIIHSNKSYDHVENRVWSIIVVNDPRINAMVLPNSMIIVFSGLLRTANDDQIGIVLSHEMSHCLLNHHAIRMSREHILEILWLIPLTLIWAVFPVPEAILSYILGNYIKNITMLYPYERDQEIEADKYGMMLAANACLDVRQAPIFWRKMEKIDPNNNSLWWLTTHPSHSERVKYVENLLPHALELRQQNGCPALDKSYWSRFSLF